MPVHLKFKSTFSQTKPMLQKKQKNVCVCICCAGAWHNKQTDLNAQRRQSDDQSLHCTSMGSQGPTTSSGIQWRMIRLGRCPGWSESLPGARVILLVLLCSSWFLNMAYLFNEACQIKGIICVKFSDKYLNFQTKKYLKVWFYVLQMGNMSFHLAS